MQKLHKIYRCQNCREFKYIDKATDFLECRECQKKLGEWNELKYVDLHDLGRVGEKV